MDPAALWTERHELLAWVLGGSLHPGGEPLTRELLATLDLRPGHQVLEIGCGSGTTARLAPPDVLWVGLDPSATALRRTPSGLTPVRATGASLPFQAGVFDRLVAECALCLLGGWNRAAWEMARVLRPGGRVGFTDFVAEDVAWTVPLWARVACVDAPAEKELVSTLEAVGLWVCQVEDVSWSLREVEARVQSRVDLRGLLTALGRVDPGSPWGEVHRFVEEARRARDAGRLRYLLVTAVREGPVDNPSRPHP